MNNKFELIGEVIKKSDTLDSREVNSLSKEYEQLILEGKIEED